MIEVKDNKKINNINKLRFDEATHIHEYILE